jgi:hypothetical protein
VRKESESSVLVPPDLRSVLIANAVKSNPRVNQRRPSVALCFLVASSDLTRDWSVELSAGAARCRSLIFYAFGQRNQAPIVTRRQGKLNGEGRLTPMLVIMSFLTGEKAADPRRSFIISLDS